MANDSHAAEVAGAGGEGAGPGSGPSPGGHALKLQQALQKTIDLVASKELAKEDIGKVFEGAVPDSIELMALSTQMALDFRRIARHRQEEVIRRHSVIERLNLLDRYKSGGEAPGQAGQAASASGKTYTPSEASAAKLQAAQAEALTVPKKRKLELVLQRLKEQKAANDELEQANARKRASLDQLSGTFDELSQEMDKAFQAVLEDS